MENREGFENIGNIPTPEEFVVFKKKVASLIELDLANYKNTQMERRIASLMHRCGIKTLLEYNKILERDPKKLEEFKNMLTINVSEFFRNSEKFAELEEKYIPELLSKKTGIKIWSAGCSIGAEIYTIAMILEKMNKLQRCELIASDFDQNIINRAKEGRYLKQELGAISEEYKSYFKYIEGTQEKYQLDSRIIKSVKFEKRDLLNSRFDTGFDLILCRNVVIYFTDEAKDKLYRNFYNSLAPGGILFIGSTERINDYKAIGYNLRSSFFYERPIS